MDRSEEKKEKRKKENFGLRLGNKNSNRIRRSLKNEYEDRAER